MGLGESVLFDLVITNGALKVEKNSGGDPLYQSTDGVLLSNPDPERTLVGIPVKSGSVSEAVVVWSLMMQK